MSSNTPLTSFKDRTRRFRLQMIRDILTDPEKFEIVAADLPVRGQWIFDQFMDVVCQIVPPNDPAPLPDDPSKPPPAPRGIVEVEGSSK